MIVNVYEAKTQLSQLLKRVILGDTIVIARDGVPVAQLVPIVSEQTARVPNLGQGKMMLADDWDSPETNARVAALVFGEPLPEDATAPVFAIREPKATYTITTTTPRKAKPRTPTKATSPVAKRTRRTPKQAK